MAGELVLLTGGTGFLGYAILVDLLRSGYRVRVAARSQAKADSVRTAPSLSALKPSATQLMFVIVPDMVTPGAYNEAVQGVDFIIHAAAPLHVEEESVGSPKGELEDTFVKTSVAGNLRILESATATGSTIRRIVMTSSTVALTPPEVYVSNNIDRDIIRGPETRVAIRAPPYASELEAYCAAKAASLKVAEAFMRDSTPSFDLITIMPSLIFGKDELSTHTEKMRTGSTNLLMTGLLTGHPVIGPIGNGVLCADVARAHVRALDHDIEGNQAFVLNIAVRWEDTIPIVEKHFPNAFKSGFFKYSVPPPTMLLKWDSSKVNSFFCITVSQRFRLTC